MSDNGQIIAFKGEVMLAGWSENHTAGRTVTFWLDEESDVHPFKTFTVKKGKTAGHRFMAVLVELNDDETPVVQSQPLGPLCLLAVQWCKDEKFTQWRVRVARDLVRAESPFFDEESANKLVICHTCHITSRKELDTNQNAASLFNEHIRKPYMEWLGEEV